MQYETQFSEDTCNLPRSSEFHDSMFDTRRIMILRNFATTCYAFLSNCYFVHEFVSVVSRTLFFTLILSVFCVAFSSLKSFRFFLCNIQNVFLWSCDESVIIVLAARCSIPSNTVCVQEIIYPDLDHHD
jgi:hypothetical protein